MFRGIIRKPGSSFEHASPRLKSRRVCAALVLIGMAASGLANAAEQRFALLLDTDNNIATGCTVGGPTGPLGGIEQVLTTVVTTTTGGATVTRIERQLCSGGILGAPAILNAGSWSAGIGNGTNGTAAIETVFALNLLPTSGSMRVTPLSTNASGGQDVTAPFLIGLAAVTPPPGTGSATVPAPLSALALVLLALCVFALAAWWQRRHPQKFNALLSISLAIVSTLAGAVALDGGIVDWSGIAAAVTSPQAGPIDADMLAVYWQKEGTNLYFRIDADVRPDSQTSGGTNTAPVVSAGSDQSITLPAAAQLAGSAVDDGLPNPPAAMTYSWSAVSGPGTVAFAAPTALQTSATFSTAGTYTLRLSAFDGDLTGHGDVHVTVQPALTSSALALAPVADSTIQLGARFQQILRATGTTTDQSLAFSLTTAPGGATLNPAPLVDWIPGSGDVGDNTFTAQVRDALGNTATTTFHVTVERINHAPTLTPQADENVAIGNVFSRTLAATDPDGDALTFALISGPAGMTLTGATLTWSSVGFAPGDYPVAVKVSDPAGLSDARTFVLHVLPAVAPVAHDDHYEVHLGETLNVGAPGVLGNDSGPINVALTATKASDPDKGTLNSFGADGSFSFTAPASIGKKFQPVTKWAYAEVNMVGDGNLRVVRVPGRSMPIVIGPLSSGGNTSGVRALDGATGAVLWTTQGALPPPNQDCYVQSSIGVDELAVGDIDDSGHAAVVVALGCSADIGAVVGEATRMVALDAETGAVKWITGPLGLPTSPSTGSTATSDIVAGVVPVIARLHSGESPSVMFKRTLAGWLDNPQTTRACDQFQANSGLQYCTGVIALNGADGTVRKKWIAPTDATTYSEMDGNEVYADLIVAPIPGSCAPCVIASGTVWDADGNLISNRINTGSASLSNALAKVDDGSTAIISYEQGSFFASTLVARRADGTVLWSTGIPGSTVRGQLSVGDVDGDGEPDIVMTVEGGVYCYDAHGNLRWYRRLADSNNNRIIDEWTRAMVFDLDGDGVAEVVFETSQGIEFLNGKDGTTEYHLGYADLGMAQTSRAYSAHLQPIIADIDGSGHASVLFYSPANAYLDTGYVVALSAQDDSWRDARPVFGAFTYHDADIDDDGSIPQTQADNFAAARTNVFGNQAQTSTPVDPRTSSQTQFTYTATAGGLTSGAATVTIDILPTNRPPVFTSAPPTVYLVGGADLANVYHPHAADPDVGDTITYAIVVATGNNVGGCQINATTGAFVPFTASMFAGDQTFVISATDSQGAQAFQSFTLHPSTGTATVPNVVGDSQTDAGSTLVGAGFSVGAINPRYDSSPAGQVLGQQPVAGASALLGQAVALAVSLGPPPVAVPDVVGLQLSTGRTRLTGFGFSALVTPVASTTAPAGEIISQSPAAGVIASPSAPVSLSVSSGAPLSGTVTKVLVMPGTQQTRITGETIQFSAIAVFADGSSTDASLQALWDSSSPGKASVDSTGLATAVAVGPATIKATLNGVSGSSALVVAAFSPGDSTLPVAQITAPMDGASVNTPMAVTGSATDANFLRYELAIAAAGSNDWSVIGSGAAAISNGTLGMLDPTSLINGAYTLRLTAFDSGRNQTLVTSGVVVSGQQKPGLFTLSYVDLSVPAAGIPLTVTRTYDSRDKSQGDFGIGWRLGLNTLRVSASVTQGLGWRVDGGGTSYVLVADRAHSVSITLPDGRVETFDLRISPNASTLEPFSTLQASYVAQPGVLGKLTCLDNTNLLIADSQPGLVSLLDDTTLSTFDPHVFRYTRMDGTQFDIDNRVGVTRVADSIGNSTTFDAAGVHASSGQSIAFARDAQNRITQITDPAGNVQTYSYSSNGDLQSHTAAVGSVSRYTYDSLHNIVGAIDPSGNQAVRNIYDDSGHLLSTTDAAGHTVTYANDASSQTETITDRLGNATVSQYDDNGNVTSTQAPVTIDGVLTLATTSSTYDAHGNTLSSVDADAVARSSTYANDQPLSQVIDPSGLGLTTAYVYDANIDPTQVTDAGGRATSLTYNSGRQATQMTLPQSGTYSGGFDGNGNLSTSTDALGATTTYTYDASGNETSAQVRDASSTLLRRTDHAYDAAGNATSETVYRTVGGAFTAFTSYLAYDANGRVIAATDALGNVSRTSYDANGRVTARTDALGRVTQFAYDALGNLSSTTFPDGSHEIQTYDFNGNVLSKTDPTGRTTTFSYDELNRQVRQTAANGTSIQTIFSAGGRVDATIDANGNRTDFAYDSADRQIGTTYAAVANGPGGSLARPQQSSTLNALGQPTSTTDANGHVTQYAYDAGGSLTTKTLADGNTIQQIFDALGRRTIVTNEEGQTTNFTYDGLGRLVAVSGLAGSAQYAYDEAGNVITQTDALGRVTQFTYDALGRNTKRQYPGGETEQSSYDAVGNLVSSTDGLGKITTYAYDAMDRLVSENLPDGSNVAYAYAPDGQRASVTDARGVTHYTYDSVGRLASVTQPDGAAIGYTYDGNDNLLSTASPAASVTYAYDAINRLTQASAPAGSSQSAYDLAGNLLRRTLGNGIVSDATFDTRNRLTQLKHMSGSTTLGEYTHAYSPSSRLTTTSEHDGSADAYTYDAKGRLASQTRTGTNPFTIAHTYDAVGNRTQTTKGATTTSYTYDNDDRLTSDGNAAYSWDANGNLVARNAASGVVRYDYDAKGRLTSIVGPVTNSQYAYDADGNRVQARTATTTTNFLVDENNPTALAQVLEERDQSGTLKANYVYGDDLVALNSGGSASMPLSDGIDNVRALTDAGGSITDTYQYDASGNAIGSTGATANPYRYRGERLDADSGQYQLRARYYDPSVGRFAARDPLTGKLDDPMSQHRYLYANSDPVNNIDPSGMEEYSVEGQLATAEAAAPIEGISIGAATEAGCSAAGTIGVVQDILILQSLALAGPTVVQNGKATFYWSWKKPRGLVNLNVESIEIRASGSPFGKRTRKDAGFAIDGNFKFKNAVGISIGYADMKGWFIGGSTTAPIAKVSACGIPIVELGVKVKAKLGLSGKGAGGIGEGVSIEIKPVTTRIPVKLEIPIIDGDSHSGFKLFGGLYTYNPIDELARKRGLKPGH